MKKTDYKFIYTFRVRYAEVDAQGIVFNAHYLTYFDCLITEYYRKLKYNYALEVKKHQKDFHVIKTTLEYKKPLLFDQLIDAGIRTSKIGNSSITFNIGLFECINSWNYYTSLCRSKNHEIYKITRKFY